MIVYFKIKKALQKFEQEIGNRFFKCRVFDANKSVFRSSKLFTVVKVEKDKQKMELKKQNDLKDILVSYLRESGIYKEEIGTIDLHIESQETVNRDWDGNWFHALFK